MEADSVVEGVVVLDEVDDDEEDEEELKGLGIDGKDIFVRACSVSQVVDV